VGLYGGIRKCIEKRQQELPERTVDFTITSPDNIFERVKIDHP